MNPFKDSKQNKEILVLSGRIADFNHGCGSGHPVSSYFDRKSGGLHCGKGTGGF